MNGRLIGLQIFLILPQRKITLLINDRCFHMTGCGRKFYCFTDQNHVVKFTQSYS